MNRLRKRLRRHTCRRWDHQWGDWQPTGIPLCQNRRCAHCGDVQSRTPFDGIHQLAIDVNQAFGNIGRGLTS